MIRDALVRLRKLEAAAARIGEPPPEISDARLYELCRDALARDTGEQPTASQVEQWIRWALQDAP